MRMRDSTAIIVGANDHSRRCLRKFLQSTCGLGHVSEVAGGSAGRSYLDQTRYDLVLLDREVCAGDETGLIEAASRTNGRVPVVIVTLLRKLASFARRLEDSRGHFQNEQLRNEALTDLLDFAQNHSGLLGKTGPTLSEELGLPEPEGPGVYRPDHLHQKMGRSSAVKSLVEDVRKVAPTNYSVLIVGETGAGKELVARALHETSQRAAKRFVAVDCGAISDTLAESEFFGHVRGAFTGAERQRPGKMRLADGGTLFLDEISSMSPNLQGTVLRAIEQSTFFPVGASDEIRVDTRVVAASNRDLRSVENFREDLYYRLAEYVIEVPPLRERKKDIPHLTQRFLHRTNPELAREVVEVSKGALRRLKSYDWPGNVRQLRNVVRQAALSARDGIVRVEHLGGPLEEARAFEAEEAEVSRDMESDQDYSLKELVQRHKERIERRVIRETLQRTDGNMAETARKLGVDYKTIYNKVKEYDIATDG
jgi:two-component system nitrogen regulation response regulator GlnG